VLVPMMLLAALLAPPAEGTPPALSPAVPMQATTIENPTADLARVTVIARSAKTAPTAATRQRLVLGDVEIPLAAAPRLTCDAMLCKTVFDLELARVPEGILALEPSALPLRWEALGADGRPVIAIADTVNLWDRDKVSVSIDRLNQLYSEVTDLALAPRGLSIDARLLIRLYNPFSFDIVATGISYKLTIGGNVVLESRRAGFRLRSRQRSDVRLDEEVGLGQAAAGLAAFLRSDPAVLDGFIVIRTPKGDKSLPLHIVTSS
jgi:hypothetical protein